MNMAVWGVALVAFFVLVMYLPIGSLHGERIFLKNLLSPSVRSGLRISSARKSLAACMALPPKERLPKLLVLERRFGGDFIAGDEIRSAVIGTGLDDAVPYLRRIMNQSAKGPGDVVSGIGAAMQTGAMEDGFRINAVKLLIDGLNNESVFGVWSERIPELLIHLDKDRAVRVLTEICDREPDHFLFTTILSLLQAYGLPVSPAVVKSILSKTENQELSRTELIAQITAAKSLHETDPLRAEEILGKIIQTQPRVALEAAETLLELRDLPHPRYLLDDLRSSRGFTAMSEAEGIVWQADHCGYLLEMDYLYRFDSEAEGDQLLEMQQAMVRVGAAKAAAKLKAYMDLYGPEGPPANVTERTRIASSKGEAWIQSVMLLDETHDSWEDITLLAIQFELQHGGEFHKASEIRKILNRPDAPSAFNR